jgi:hypothetical protein
VPDAGVGGTSEGWYTAASAAATQYSRPVTDGSGWYEGPPSSESQGTSSRRTIFNHSNCGQNLVHLDEPCWKSVTACYQGGSWFHVHHCRGSAQALKFPGSEGALSFYPILPALKPSMSGCPFKVGAVGLAPTTPTWSWVLSGAILFRELRPWHSHRQASELGQVMPEGSAPRQGASHKAWGVPQGMGRPTRHGASHKARGVPQGKGCPKRLKLPVGQFN